MNGMPAGTRVCQSLLGQRDIADLGEKMSMQLFPEALRFQNVQHPLLLILPVLIRILVICMYFPTQV